LQASFAAFARRERFDVIANDAISHYPRLSSTSLFVSKASRRRSWAFARDPMDPVDAQPAFPRLRVARRRDLEEVIETASCAVE
jgi:hypothetical protein